MCGTSLHMLDGLLIVITQQTPKINKVLIDRSSRVFMYAKRDCGYSKKAYRLLKRLKINLDNLTVVDPLKKKYICSKKWEYVDTQDEELKKVIDLWNPGERTFPDIYVHEHPQWKYVGGCDNLVSATASNTGSDLMHLLPTKEYTGKNGLKF